MSSSQRRAHYQNLKGMGEETVEFGASGTTSSAMTGKAKHLEAWHGEGEFHGC
jgi:hypothetical protein